MQINNNPSVQNFGMALRVDKTARKVLEGQTPEMIESIVKAGRELADTKLYHVEIGADSVPKIVADKDAYFGVCNQAGLPKLTRGAEENIVMINNDNGVATAGVARYVPYGQSVPFFNVWGTFNRPYNTLMDVERLASVAKALDKVAVAKYAEDLAKAEAEAAKAAEVSKAVDSLLNEFGV